MQGSGWHRVRPTLLVAFHRASAATQIVLKKDCFQSVRLLVRAASGKDQG
jgi:hypothetical protein